MLYTLFIRAGLLLATIIPRGLLVSAASTALSPDPCAKIAGLQYVDVADAIACQKSFAFNEMLKQNVLSVVSVVFDFYTFEEFYLNSPAPFEESTKDIRAEIARMNATQYATDYDFNLDMWDFTTQLNDGHTRWYPQCYNTYQALLPAPVVILNDGAEDGIFIVPDAVDLLNSFGSNFTDFFAAKQFNWERLAGARVHSIGGLSVSDYLDEVARNSSGNYLDHNVRLNSVVSSYLINDNQFSQCLGDLASSFFLTQTSLTFSITTVNSTSPETVEVPFVASFIGNSFTDGQSYWANNCAANNKTNGVDSRLDSGDTSPSQRRHARAARMDINHPKTRISLPNHPESADSTLMTTDGSPGVIKSFILPGNNTGVLFVGSFDGNFTQFQSDVDSGVKQLKASGVTNLVIDVTNNGGGFVCLGVFLHQFLAGTGAGSPPYYHSTSRANPFAQDIVKANVELRLNSSTSLYASGNWRFLNGTQMPNAFDYSNPSLPYVINGRNDSTSQLFADICPSPKVSMPTAPPFDLDNVLIVGNGNCASTCAHFTTFMYENYQTKMVVFGGNQSRSIEYKGMAGMQVLEWVDFDSQIKTAGLKNDSRAPPDLLVNGNMRLNWRTAYSFLNETIPIAYRSEPPQYRFPYTATTYKSPEAVWLFMRVSPSLNTRDLSIDWFLSEEQFFTQDQQS
ncbi:hypothetical protein EI94DRAFT_1580944 [Lactarius quietus]|nr:hypothetical protein EI94DRAFT_1580944 [Lactarius quietus]